MLEIARTKCFKMSDLNSVVEQRKFLIYKVITRAVLASIRCYHFLRRGRKSWISRKLALKRAEFIG